MKNITINHTDTVRIDESGITGISIMLGSIDTRKVFVVDRETLVEIRRIWEEVNLRQNHHTAEHATRMSGEIIRDKHRAQCVDMDKVSSCKIVLTELIDHLWT